MSQYPSIPNENSPHALAYSQPYAPTGPRRPTSVTVIAVFTIIFGVLGVLGVTVQFLQMIVPGVFQFGGPNPVNDLMHNDRLIAFWSAHGGHGAILAIMELAGGIGALSLKPWARKALIAYAIGAIVTGLVGTIFNFTVMLPRLSQIPQNRPEVRMTIQLMPIMTIGGFLLGLILPVCVLIFMTRAKVKAAFAGQVAPEDVFHPGAAGPAHASPG